MSGRSRRTKSLWPNGKRSAVIYFPGVDWDAVPGTDRQLVTALGKLLDVVWVDPPQSVWSAFRRHVSIPRVSHVDRGVVRLHSYAPPGVTRPGVRKVAEVGAVGQLTRYLKRNGVEPAAVIASGTQPFLARFAPVDVPRIFFATDDVVAGAELWGMSSRQLCQDREANLRAASLILAVTSELADALSRPWSRTVVFPNGCDEARYAAIESVAPAPDVHLRQPIAGVIGQFNERTDIAFLEAVEESCLSLLLVGPRHYASAKEEAAFERLATRPGVQWIDRVPAERLPAYLRTVSVGLTPYADNRFNRRSFPLKTLDYLSAGVPVVASDVAPTSPFDARFVRTASGPADFAASARELASQSFRRSHVQESVSGLSWTRRATDLMTVLEQAPT